jgi:hypothetical protein
MNHKQLCKLAFSHFHFNQIATMDLEDLIDTIWEIESDVLEATGARQGDEQPDFDQSFYVERYFARNPTPKWERLLEEFKKLFGECWYE